MNEVIIKSVDTAAKLVFSDFEGEYFTASYESFALRVSIRVWGYSDCQFLADLFEDMANEWQGFKGKKDWASIEGEFSISCVSDKVGHVQLQLQFVNFEGSEPWKVEPTLNLEAGLMEGLAKDIRGFFG